MIAVKAAMRKERVAAKYKMPEQHVDAITAIVQSRPNAKSADVEGLVLKCLNVKGREELVDFPSTVQLKKMFTTIKRKKSKEIKMELKPEGSRKRGRDGNDTGTNKRQRR